MGYKERLLRRLQDHGYDANLDSFPSYFDEVIDKGATFAVLEQCGSDFWVTPTRKPEKFLEDKIFNNSDEYEVLSIWHLNRRGDWVQAHVDRLVIAWIIEGEN